MPGNLVEYDVHLVITPAGGDRFERLGEVFEGSPFPVEIEERDDGLLGVWCRGIRSAGILAMPEALRLAQIGLSIPLKNAYPAYAGRGLLWSDVVSAEVRTVT